MFLRVQEKEITIGMVNMRDKKTMVFPVILADICCLGSIQSHGEPQQDSPASKEAAVLFKQVEDRFDLVQSLQYTVERASGRAMAESKERWRFSFVNPSKLRVDYEAPLERLIVMNEEVFWEYIPAARKAAKTDLTRLSDLEKQKLVSMTMARLSIDGLRMGNYQTMLDRVVSVKSLDRDPNIVVVEGEKPRFVLKIDKAKKALVQTEIYDEKGLLQVITRAKGFSEVAPGYWWPEEIAAEYETDKGVLIARVHFSEIHVNETIPEKQFTYTPVAGVQVLEK